MSTAAAVAETALTRALLVERAREVISEGEDSPVADVAEAVVAALVGDLRTYRQQVRYRAVMQAARTIEGDSPDAAEQLRALALLIDAGVLMLTSDHPDVERATDEVAEIVGGGW